MSFQSGLSGLNVASKDLDVIGNNVANSSVVGFKAARAEFADVFASALNGSGALQSGIGAKLSAISVMFNQGNITTTGSALDVAINGRGFFRMNNNGVITYSRNGQFKTDAGGYLVNSDGLQVTGYLATNGIINAAQPLPLQLSSANVPPKATTLFNMTVNLSSNDTVPTVATFNSTNTASYNFAATGSVYDTLGNAHVLTNYFVKTATANQWQMYGVADGVTPSSVDYGAGAGLPVTLTFNPNTGGLSGFTPLASSLSSVTGSVSPVAFSLDLKGSTQTAATQSSINSLSQDGYATGSLVGYAIDKLGVISGNYSNGQTTVVAQMVMADFRNPQGLTPTGNNQFEETTASGLPVIGDPGTGSLGVVQSSAVEESNVDLTSELVHMITAQRDYQANAQTIKTESTIMQTLVNL